MLDVEKFLVALRSNKDLDGKLKPIFLADTVQEEIKIIQAAVDSSRREWVGLTDEEVVGIGNASGLKAKPTSTGIIIHPDGIKIFFQAIEAKLREKNHG